jgi:transcriptional regulator with XRE-family HTH domain
MKINSLKKSLPHGAVKEIAKKMGLSTYTISRALNGHDKSPRLSDIIKATADYLAEFKAKEVEALQALNNVLQSETSEHLATRLQFQREKYGEGTSPIL